ncbi:MAG: preprotein translocase subunit SecD [Chloroflexota bacterium]|jgi:preprotein translocase subunit SecD|nr:preprotein translocase subunit SecD [Chloroflexota bacterium]
MRRLLPLLIIVVGFAAVAIDFAPIGRPFSDPPVPIDTRLGLDLQGGLRGEYRALPANGVPVTATALANIRTIIENRINQFGVAEPVVQTQGSDRIVVEIPGVTDEQQVRALIGSTGQLNFVDVPDARSAQVIPGQPIPPDLAIIFSGDKIASAAPGFTQTGLRAVEVTMTAEGARLFDQYAASHFGKQFAIVLDNIVQSAPVIQAQRFGGKAQISGSFTTQAEVNQLVTVLNYGALPNAVEEVSFSKISATLGLNFLQQSILAGAIGIALVFVFMLLHYRLPGLVACLALIYYALVVYAVFRLVPVTLTLAGVAAFVLSVGMAVDANILIFERTKEELRSGKTLVSAVEAGFNRAWNSIFDSNMSSIITAGILFYFGSATIRGFALVLIIGVLISMFTAVTLSRRMLRLVVHQPWARKASYYGVAEDEFTVAGPAGRRGPREASARV